MTARQQAQSKTAPRIAETDSPHQIGIASADETAGNGEPFETAGDIVRNGAVDLIFDAGVEPKPAAVLRRRQAELRIVGQTLGREVAKQRAAFEMRDGLLARRPLGAPIAPRACRRPTTDEA